MEQGSNTFTSDRIESKKMEIFFDLPCRIVCLPIPPLKPFQSEEKKKNFDSDYFRVCLLFCSADIRETILKNVLDRKKKVFFPSYLISIS